MSLVQKDAPAKGDAPAKAALPAELKGEINSKIYDADGDGIEDIKFHTFEELDQYYQPLVFGHAEDLFNTLNGEMPGHQHKSFDVSQVEPVDHYTLTRLRDLQ